MTVGRWDAPASCLICGRHTGLCLCVHVGGGGRVTIWWMMGEMMYAGWLGVSLSDVLLTADMSIIDGSGGRSGR